MNHIIKPLTRNNQETGFNGILQDKTLPGDRSERSSGMGIPAVCGTSGDGNGTVR